MNSSTFSVNCNLKLPHLLQFDEPLHQGALIIIVGKTIPRPYRFAIDFVNDDKEDADILLHFNPRFDENCVVRNSYINGVWGIEERQASSSNSCFPFSAELTFELIFLVKQHSFMIAVNGSHFAEFDHRLNYVSTKYLRVTGDLAVNSLTYKDDLLIASKMTLELMPIDWQAIYNPTVPFRFNLANKIKDGFTLFITGKPTKSADSFRIDFWAKNDIDICLHFNPRFNERQIVRNSLIDGDWGDEEREFVNFNFIPLVNFDIIITFDTKRFIFSVDGRYFFDYYHRIPFTDIGFMSISGDVSVTCVRYNFVKL